MMIYTVRLREIGGEEITWTGPARDPAAALLYAMRSYPLEAPSECFSVCSDCGARHDYHSPLDRPHYCPCDGDT